MRKMLGSELYWRQVWNVFAVSIITGFMKGRTFETLSEKIEYVLLMAIVAILLAPVAYFLFKDSNSEV